MMMMMMMMMMRMRTDDNGGDDNVDDDTEDRLLQMGRFQVSSSLCFKARLSAKPVIRK